MAETKKSPAGARSSGKAQSAKAQDKTQERERDPKVLERAVKSLDRAPRIPERPPRSASERGMKPQDQNEIFALDIGTRSIIGVLGRVEDARFHVLAIEKADHGQRAMLDGQIEDIDAVAAVAKTVTQRLESVTRTKLSRVCVAAAGRALRSETAAFTLELAGTQQISEDIVSQLEAGAVSEAERALIEPDGSREELYYMVGYTVTAYRLDGYPMSSVKEHSGKILEAEVVATFLPRGVVESLYAVVGKIGLEVASLTLEPIAALNAAIPGDIRLLNLALVDIGAGTSDIAACRDGSVVGYTMATIAGDEITELLMRALLVDFQTGETLKKAMRQSGKITYTDILGLDHETTSEELAELIEPAVDALAQEIAGRVLDLNGKTPSAVFLAGGGSKLLTLRERVAEELKMDAARVAVAGNHFEKNAFSEDYDLDDPEYATPLGIAVSAGLGLINDSYVVELNGAPAKLFRSGVLVMRDILLMNGYRYADLIGKTGANLSFTLNGEREFFRGALATPPVILLNGDAAELSDLVHAGDAIIFTPAKPGADAERTLADLLGDDFTGEVTVNGTPAELGRKLQTGDEVWADGFTRGHVPAAAESAVPKPPAPKPGPPLRLVMNGAPLTLPGKRSGEPYYLMDLLEFSGLDFNHMERPVEMLVNGDFGQFSQRLFEDDDVIIR